MSKHRTLRNQNHSTDCLFRDVEPFNKPCSGISSEHLIQENIGGRHQCPDTICFVCNHDFGEKIDPGIGEFYSLLIDKLRPFMPSGFSKIERRTKSVMGDVPLKLRAGGVAELGTNVYIERNSDGSIQSFNFNTNTTLEERQKIVAAYGFVYDLKQELSVSLTEITPVPTSRHRFKFQQPEHRAASKAILEVVDWWTRSVPAKRYSRYPQLRRARDYVRNGTLYEYADGYPMYRLEDKFAQFFGDNEDSFYNRVLFCNDVKANRCIGLLQIANTMPIGIDLGESIEDIDLTIFYEASLLKGGNGRSDKIDELLISYKDFKEASFGVLSKENSAFSYAKVMQSYDQQCGRATFLVDVKDDKNVPEFLRQQAVAAVERYNVAEIGLLRAICEPIVQMRFPKCILTATDWEEFSNSSRQAGFDPKALETAIRATKIMGSQGETILRCFRNLMRLMVGRHGYPRVLSQ